MVKHFDFPVSRFNKNHLFIVFSKGVSNTTYHLIKTLHSHEKTDSETVPKHDKKLVVKKFKTTRSPASLSSTVKNPTMYLIINIYNRPKASYLQAHTL